LRSLPRWLWLLALFLALLWYWNGSRPVRHAPGVLAGDPPLQQSLQAAPAQPLRKGDVAIKPLATFSMSARVLSRADYRWDSLAALVPVDLALGWGRMSDSAVLERVRISQSGRFFLWSVDQFPIPERELIESAANMHLIPADSTIERAIKRTRVGDVVTFEIKFAPCAKPMMNRFGKPCTWIPCIECMPSRQHSESRSPLRPIVS